MAVLMNFKICDNAKECDGIKVCPTGALSWDSKKLSIVVDNEKCTNCGLCQKACLVGAIKVAKNEKEFNEIKEEFRKDKRKINDLFIDRYGAKSIGPNFMSLQKNFEITALESQKLTVIELFNESSSQCLIYSIPIKELFRGIDIKYRKMEVEDKKILADYKIKELPSLLFFNNGKMIGKIQGYYNNRQKNKLIEKIKKIIK